MYVPSVSIVFLSSRTQPPSTQQFPRPPRSRLVYPLGPCRLGSRVALAVMVVVVVCVRARVCACMWVGGCVCVCVCARAHARTRARAHAHTHIVCPNQHTHVRARVRRHTHLRTRTRTRTPTYHPHPTPPHPHTPTRPHAHTPTHSPRVVDCSRACSCVSRDCFAALVPANVVVRLASGSGLGCDCVSCWAPRPVAPVVPLR